MRRTATMKIGAAAWCGPAYVRRAPFSVTCRQIYVAVTVAASIQACLASLRSIVVLSFDVERTNPKAWRCDG
jgi:hypothetical protein